MAMDGVFNNLTPGSSYFDPEHMSFGDGGEGRMRTENEMHATYTATRDEFARVRHLNLSEGHPHLHGGHRTVEDIKNDLDTGHRIMGNGKAPHNRMLGKLNAWHYENAHQHNFLHQDALEAGYAANAHIYMGREAKAKREAGYAADKQARDAKEAANPTNLWDPKTYVDPEDSFDWSGEKEAATKAAAAKSLWDDSGMDDEPAAPKAAPKKSKGLLGKLRKKG